MNDFAEMFDAIVTLSVYLPFLSVAPVLLRPVSGGGAHHPKG
ncbi:hypothetical protein [Rhodococcus rhodochrous]|nr:hypothetical protein [Rhodococcus rhodochrous]